MSNGEMVCLHCGAIIHYQLVKPEKCPKCGQPLE